MKPLCRPNFADPAIGYAQYIDVQSWIDYHIMTELTYNVDEWDLSTYLSKDRGGKLTLGPFWDFDRSSATPRRLAARERPAGIPTRMTSFFASFWAIRQRRSSSIPGSAVCSRTRISPSNTSIAIRNCGAPSFPKRISPPRSTGWRPERIESQARNFQRWPTLNSVISPSPFAFPTYQQHVRSSQELDEATPRLDRQPLPAGPTFNQNGGEVPDGFQVIILGTAASIYFTMDGFRPARSRRRGRGTAQAYELPITITGPTTVQARIRSGTNWSGLTKAVFYPPQTSRSLRSPKSCIIPPAFGALSGDELEFLELKNTGTEHAEPRHAHLHGRHHVHVHQRARGSRRARSSCSRATPPAFASKYPGVAVNGVYSGRLDNGGETLPPRHALGSTVLSVDLQRPRAVAARAGWLWLLRSCRESARASATRTTASHWRASSAVRAARPARMIRRPRSPPVLINEILTHTDPPRRGLRSNCSTRPRSTWTSAAGS